LEAIDSRLPTANVDDLPQLVQVRASILSQDATNAFISSELRKTESQQRHRQFMAKARLASKVGLSALAMGAGLTLCLCHLALPGLFILGAGVHFIAPAYVRENVEAFRHGGGGDDD